MILSHEELILCPKCESVETATVEHTTPFYSYAHQCENCGYLIGESEWRIVHRSFMLRKLAKYKERAVFLENFFKKYRKD